MSNKDNNAEFIDQLMGFDPSEVAAFNEPENKPAANPNQYRTRPADVDKKVSEDGHYRAKIRIVYNPHNMKQSIVNNAHYAMNDANGFFMVDSVLAHGDRNCFMFKAWKQLHFSKDETKIRIDGKEYTRKEWGDHMFDKGEEQFVLVQVIDDPNQPDKVGKFLGWRLPKFIFDTLEARMHPTDKSKAPQDLMNYLFGPVLELDVAPGPDDPAKPERKTREISYKLSQFETDPTPIITVTGEDFVTEEEMDMINDYATAKAVITNPKSSQKKKDEAMAKCKELVEPLKTVMNRAIEYVKENAPNIEEEFGYHEPSAALKARAEKWIDIVVNKLADPVTYQEGTATTAATSQAGAEVPTETPVQMPAESAADDLPF